MDSKKKLVATAANLIHTKGFNNTSVQDILDDAVVARSNFYYHFDSKEQLGFEVLARRMRWWYAYVIEPSLDRLELSPQERIDVLLDRICSIGTSEMGGLGCPFGNLAQEMSCTHESFRQALSDFFSSIVHRLEDCFEEGKSGGVFLQTLPSRELAEFAVAQIQGSFLLRKTHKNPRLFENNIALLRQMLSHMAMNSVQSPPSEETRTA
jgi:TetR/AcrR family transcriptional repressor of nem operon